MDVLNSRRDFMVLSAMAAASAAAPVAVSAAGESAATTHGAADAFRGAHAGKVDAAQRAAFLLTDGLAVTSDVPFPMDHQAYSDHLAFHQENWDLHEWHLQDLETVALEDGSAIVSCFYIERGKPRDAGFRLRPGFATATCVMEGGEWMALSVHFSSLRSQILDSSPS